MKTLLIWNKIDDIDYYLIDDAPEWLARCHGYCIGFNNPEGVDGWLNRASDALCDIKEYRMNVDDELGGAWVDKKVDGEEAFVFNEPITVIICGFVP